MNTSNARFWAAASCTGAGVYWLTYGALAGITSMLGLSVPASPETTPSLLLSTQVTPMPMAYRRTAASYVPAPYRSANARTSAASVLPRPATALWDRNASASAAGPQENAPTDTIFAGIVTVDGEQRALLESKQTHEGWYVAVGDDWNGWKVQTIDAQEIRLQAGTASRAIALNEVTSFASLSADAPVPTLSAEQPAMGSVSAFETIHAAQDAQAVPLELTDIAIDDFRGTTVEVDFDTVELTDRLPSNVWVRSISY